MKRKHLIVIQEDASDEGSNVPNWSDLITEFGRITEKGGSQGMRGDELSETGKVEIQMIRREGVMPNQRVKFVDRSYSTARTRFFNIEDVRLDETAQPHLILTCHEVKNG